MAQQLIEHTALTGSVPSAHMRQLTSLTLLESQFSRSFSWKNEQTFIKHELCTQHHVGPVF